MYTKSDNKAVRKMKRRETEINFRMIILLLYIARGLILGIAFVDAYLDNAT